MTQIQTQKGNQKKMKRERKQVENIKKIDTDVVLIHLFYICCCATLSCLFTSVKGDQCRHFRLIRQFGKTLYCGLQLHTGNGIHLWRISLKVFWNLCHWNDLSTPTCLSHVLWLETLLHFDPQTMDAFSVSCIAGLVLDEDGTGIDTEDFFQTLKDSTRLMVLEKGQKWMPQQVLIPRWQKKPQHDFMKKLTWNNLRKGIYDNTVIMPCYVRQYIFVLL